MSRCLSVPIEAKAVGSLRHKQEPKHGQPGTEPVNVVTICVIGDNFVKGGIA